MIKIPEGATHVDFKNGELIFYYPNGVEAMRSYWDTDPQKRLEIINAEITKIEEEIERELANQSVGHFCQFVIATNKSVTQEEKDELQKMDEFFQQYELPLTNS